jgi:hypothetical protein
MVRVKSKSTTFVIRAKKDKRIVIFKKLTTHVKVPK